MSNYSYRQSPSTQRSIQAIESHGHKIQSDKIMRAWEVPATSEFPPKATGGARPGHMWLEEGNSRAGFAHMQSESKQKSFRRAGIPDHEQAEKLPVLCQAHTTVGRHIGFQGSDVRRPIMSTYIEDRVQRTAMTVGSNGFVVGANPVSSSYKPSGAAGHPGEVSDRTMKNLYSYPAHYPDRRRTD